MKKYILISFLILAISFNANALILNCSGPLLSNTTDCSLYDEEGICEEYYYDSEPPYPCVWGGASCTVSGDPCSTTTSTSSTTTTTEATTTTEGTTTTSAVTTTYLTPSSTYYPYNSSTGQGTLPGIKDNLGTLPGTGVSNYSGAGTSVMGMGIDDLIKFFVLLIITIVTLALCKINIKTGLMGGTITLDYFVLVMAWFSVPLSLLAMLNFMGLILPNMLGGKK